MPIPPEFHTYGYNQAGQRTYLKRLDGTGDAYAYNQAGQVIAAELKVDDPADRAIDLAVAQYAYTYDKTGNRIKTRIDQKVTDYQPDDVNQYQTIGGDDIKYHLNGNLTEAKFTRYTWNQDNRLVKADTAKGLATFTYDPFGRRTSKTTKDGTTIYI